MQKNNLSYTMKLNPVVHFHISNVQAPFKDMYIEGIDETILLAGCLKRIIKHYTISHGKQVYCRMLIF